MPDRHRRPRAAAVLTPDEMLDTRASLLADNAMLTEAAAFSPALLAARMAQRIADNATLLRRLPGDSGGQLRRGRP